MSNVIPAGGERIGFYHGSLLTARDLRDDLAHEERLHSLHVRALHDVWGIGLGLALSLTADRRAVLVAPGVAYDAHGREIVLTAPTRLTALPVTGGLPRTFDVVIRFAVPSARPRLRWIDAEAGWRDGGGARGLAARTGLDLPLGQVVQEPDGTLQPPTPFGRQYARGLTGPRTALNVVRGSELRWEVVTGNPQDRPSGPQVGIGLIATVDTSAAGFSTTPAYVVALLHDPWSARTIQNIGDQAPADVFAFTSIAEAQPDRFRLRLLFGARTPWGDDVGSLIWDARRGADLATFIWLAAETLPGGIDG
jgi:hypothetical protein